MPQEIIFKAKRIDTGEWVEGNFITNGYKSFITWFHSVDFWEQLEVNPLTVCHSFEMEGKRYFEGDKGIAWAGFDIIIRYGYYENTYSGGYGWYAVKLKNNYNLPISKGLIKEITGNIHD